MVSKDGKKGSNLCLVRLSKRPTPTSKRRYPIGTAGQWPWKPASAKECVTAHQPNGAALKMDEVKSEQPYQAESQIKLNE